MARIENHKYSIEEAFRECSTSCQITSENTSGRTKKFSNS